MQDHVLCSIYDLGFCFVQSTVGRHHCGGVESQIFSLYNVLIGTPAHVSWNWVQR